MLLSIITWKALADPLHCLPCFFKLILGPLGRSVNFEIPNRFLCRRPVFPDYLSVSCDYVWNIIQVKDEGKNVMFLLKKDISKVKNTMLQWILQNIWEDQTFQRIAKFMMTDSYEMDFMIGIVTLVKVDEIHNILKSASHCLLVKR